jgi:hypothetical protein
MREKLRRLVSGQRLKELFRGHLPNPAESCNSALIHPRVTPLKPLKLCPVPVAGNCPDIFSSDLVAVFRQFCYEGVNLCSSTAAWSRTLFCASP